MNDELKPCPFCGSPAVHEDNTVFATCTNPDCDLYNGCLTVAQWNTRPVEDQIRAKMEIEMVMRESYQNKVIDAKVAEIERLSQFIYDRIADRWTDLQGRTPSAELEETILERIDEMQIDLGIALNEAERVKELTAQLKAANDSANRMLTLASELNQERAELREMALELKRMYAASIEADRVGCLVEWMGENGRDYRELETALMNRLTKNDPAQD